ncbi:hypothetical protein DMUE_1472 [Dictyocoela muelleri]|nr:hypothetical protein DMUE_1472 [Dictyocoela muelleri]
MAIKQMKNENKKIKNLNGKILENKELIAIKVLEKLHEIDNNLDLIKICQKKRRKLYYETYPLPRCTGEETNNDLMEIKGSLKIKVIDKVLHVGAIVFRKGDQVEVNLYGEVYNGHINSINSKEIILKTITMQKVKIQVLSIKKKMAIISKVNYDKFDPAVN